MSARTAFGSARLAVAVLGVVALVFRFEWGLGSATFTPTNFFAYLTIQSNMAYVALGAFCGIRSLRGLDDTPRISAVRAALVTFVLVAGVVFAVLIEQAGQRSYRIDVPWSDVVLHFVIPVWAVLDWLVAPGRQRVGWPVLSVVVGYPVVWGVLTLIRGAIVGWYPYFFLDPAQVRDLGEFALFSGLALSLFTGIAAAVIAASRRRPIEPMLEDRMRRVRVTRISRR